MKTRLAQTTVVLSILTSFLISLPPHVPAKPTFPSRAQPERIAGPSSDTARAEAREAYGKLPLSFEPNRGQADKQFKFLSRGSGYALFLTATEALLALNDSSETPQRLRMKIVGGNPAAKLTGERRLEGESNYLIGNDRPDWKLNVPTYGSVRAKGVYPGVDVVYYGTDQGRLEYDFVIAPGADHGRIRLAFAGAESLSLDAEGGLRLKLTGGEILQPAPVVYQEADGKRQTVAGHYVLAGSDEVVFEIAEYDRSRTLVIDPQIVYASFHGGSGDDRAEGIDVDANGNAYVVGLTPSPNLPTETPFQSSLKGSFDIFVVKINSAGTDRVYSTYLGGSSSDTGRAIAVTSDGKACVTGTTNNTGNSSDYPITASRYQGNGFGLASRGVDSVLTVLTPAGNGLVYSTFLGGGEADGGHGIAVDGTNKIYIAGDSLSRDFPTKNAYQRNPGHRGYGRDAFVAKFDPSQSGNDSLVYSTYLGGGLGGDAAGDYANDIAVTAAGVAFVVGETDSTDFPTKSSSSLPPLREDRSGPTDGFVAKFSPSGDLIYSTYFGGNGDDEVTNVVVDSVERAYVTGPTSSSAATFPLKNAFDSTRNGTVDTFVAKFNADGTALFYSSFINGSGQNTRPGGIAVDPDGNAFLTGSSVGPPFPIIDGFPANVPRGPLFLVKIGPSDATGTNVPGILLSDSLAGGGPSGLALDPRGNVYIAGSVTGNFPIVTPGAFQQTFAGGANDAFVLKISFPNPDTIGVFRPSTNQFLLRNSNTTGAADENITFGQPGDKPIAGDWGGNGTTDVGVFRNGQFLLRQPFIIPGRILIATITVNFGQAGDLPVVGDWNGDGVDTPGVFRPSTGQWLLTNGPNTPNSTPAVVFSFTFGQAGDTPLAGDWDGDGIDTVGLFRSSAATFILSNTFNGTIDITPFLFGSLGSVPLTGDWNGDGVDTIGTFQSNIGAMTLNNTNTSGNGLGDLVFDFGQSGDVPLAGDWDGQP